MCSVLHEIEGNELHDDEVVGPVADSERGVLSLDAIAAVVRQGFQTAVEHTVTGMSENFDKRIGSLEKQLSKVE